jgi:hypothetical protein
MTDHHDLADDALTLDANAVAGLLHEVFGEEMTAHESRCAHCANEALLGTLRAYDMAGPGVVLRCSICTGVMLVLVRRADGSVTVDQSGVAYLKRG